VLRGFDAVPDLISLISDQRITVHIDPRGGRDTILRFGELALTLLAEISGKQVAEVESWDAWWAKARLLKEEEFFAEAAFLLEEGKITWVNSGPVRILGRKYPARLTLLCEEFSKRGFSETQPFSLAEAVAESPQPLDKRVQILAEFALRGSLAHKRSVLQVLAKLDGEKCSKLLTPILKTLPTDSKKSYWTCEEAAFTHVVMQIEDDDIWREYLRAAKRSSIGLRMEMMNPMNYTYIGGKNRQRRLAFLAAFLDDAAVRDKATDPEEFGGPSAGFAIPKITVRDFAANKMASILDLGDDLDTVSAAAEWEKLRERVRAKLAAEMLPDLTGK
jgi:hypothetical protein